MQLDRNIVTAMQDQIELYDVSFDLTVQIDVESIRPESKDGSKGQPWREQPKQSGKKDIYTYKAPKSWDLQANQFVVVPTGNSMSIARVIGIGKFQTNLDYTYRFMISKIDATEYNQLVEKENLYQEAVTMAETVSQRELLRTQMESLMKLSPALTALVEKIGNQSQSQAKLNSPQEAEGPNA